MHLSKLFIKNYRSIRQLELVFSPGKNVILGRNNSGKSNILSAINLVLGENSPDYKKSENVTETDFFTQKVKRGRGVSCKVADEIFIWCELSRSEGEALDFEELYKSYGFYVYSERPRSSERKRLNLDSLADADSTIFEITEDVNEKTYLNPKLRNQGTLETEFNDKHRFAFAFRAVRAGDGVEKEIRFLYRENESVGWVLAFRASVRNALLQSAIIPSFRDPHTQLRISSWSWYGKLLRYLTQGSTNLPRLTKALAKLQSVANEVFAQAQTTISQSSLSVAFPGTELSFQFATDKHDDLYKGCVIYVDDGFKSLLTEKGAGIQSATIIGLFNFYTQEVNTTGSALLGIEEPELYLHPHARRVVSDRLDEFLDSNRNQVILTTHSVEFLRTTATDVNVVTVRKSASGETTAKAVNLRAFQSLLRDNNQNELFFADKVIVCEGFDEYILKAAARELFKGRLDEDNISVVAVSGKDNFAPLVKLILRLEIECFVFADFDFLLRDKSAARKTYDAKAHDSVVNLPSELFGQARLLGKRSRAVIKQLQRVREIVKERAEKEFYQAKRAVEIPFEGIAALTSALRKAGLGLLDGELEDLSKDPTFLSATNKMSLDKIYRIRSRLIAGEKLSSFIDISQLHEFFSAVFEKAPNPESKWELIQQAGNKIQ